MSDPSLNAMLLPKRMNIFSLNTLNAATEHIEDINTSRKNIGRLYSEKLEENNNVIIPTKRNDIPFLRYSIIFGDPKGTKSMVKKLNLSGYECGNFNWGAPLNRVLNIPDKFENSEYIAKNIINLPCHFSMDESDVFKICEIIRNRSL